MNGSSLKDWSSACSRQGRGSEEPSEQMSFRELWDRVVPVDLSERVVKNLATRFGGSQTNRIAMLDLTKL